MSLLTLLTAPPVPRYLARRLGVIAFARHRTSSADVGGLSAASLHSRRAIPYPAWFLPAKWQLRPALVPGHCPADDHPQRAEREQRWPASLPRLFLPPCWRRSGTPANLRARRKPACR